MGKSGSSSSSRPLTAEERKELFDQGLTSITSGDGARFRNVIAPSYSSPAFEGGGSGGRTSSPKGGQVDGGVTPGYAYRDAGSAERLSFTDPGEMSLESSVGQGFYDPGRFTDPGEASRAIDPGRSNVSMQVYDPGSGREAVDPGSVNRLAGGDYDRLEQSIIESRLAPLRQFEQRQREALDQSLADRGIYSSGLAVEAQNDLSRELAPTISQAANEAVTTRYGFEQGDNQSANRYQLGRSGILTDFNKHKDQYQLGRSEMLNNQSLARGQARDQFALGRSGMLNEFNQNADQYGMQRADMANQYGLSRAGMLNEQDLARGQAQDQYRLGAQSANTDRARYLADAALQERQGRLGYNLESDRMMNEIVSDEAQRRYDSQWRPLDYLQGLWNETGGTISSSGSSGWKI